MKIDRLEIENFRGIARAAFDFRGENAVLVGVNGAGKTAVLDSLALALDFLVRLNPEDRTPDLMRRTPLESPVVSGRMSAGETPVLLGILPGDPKDVRSGSEDYRVTLFGTVLGEAIGCGVRFGPGHSGRPCLINALSTFLRTKQAFADHVDSGKPAPIASYYSTNRQVEGVDLSVGEPSELSQAANYVGSLNRKTDFDAFFRWFRMREDLENETRQIVPLHRDPQLEAVRRAVPSVLPGYDSLRVKRSLNAFVVSKGDEEFSITQLSHGERTLIALIADIARRLAASNPGVADPLLGEGVVLIDEVELHLHPGWQRLILPALARTFPNVQFIASTHSPQVLSEIRPENVFLLLREEGTVKVARIGASYGRDANQILEDVMGIPDRPEPFKERLADYFQLIDKGRLEEARTLRFELEAAIGSDEPAFAKADVLMRRKEALLRAADSQGK